MPDPIVLGFDTSAAHCAAALLCGDTVLAQTHQDMTRGQAERLFPILQSMLTEAGLGWADLTAIGVGIGPGNFTGIRVAVAAARGLSLSLGIPAIGIGATEAAAFGVERPCRIVIPSRRDQVIWQDFTGSHMDGESRPQQAANGALPPGPAPAAPAVPLAEGIARLAMARRHQPVPRPAPIYLRPADAAPPSDPPPVILP
ncbi:tRNA (adenosine(37)-N6)-threonylcarbamoyltransferase complex dimerization subunit type 1 TsaB [Paracoccus sp. Z330]|uniref:tRNA (Adenosine(37)-N6)-threonylcarbamoyltransferase complex dimerization subunit type 1 TsaB n=1 Tax=Paracoccus onchidii TaxID=3017813 RepID=A0ABT4ZBW1_9RHOB|nr:tRNA (adenosine(37)-N6)-threonylcarbamoyltransferase complex dimerization subunit type 1 TsaB [Paracoccus onchidii]MDB6176853.1 tRNA (adenosine(37)-N6)-threonylcarbamoyltransferase complex dimerization subunit type 1 TsaB [Paracoccus onchidii]